MKINHLLKKIIFLSFFLSLFFVYTPENANAIGVTEPLKFQPQTTIPNLWTKGTEVTLEKSDTSVIASMIKGFYNYGIGIAGILAAIMLMAGGIIWLTSAGSSEKVSQAKNLLGGSVIGLVILFGSWIMLRTINPALVDFRIQDIVNIDPIFNGCCQYSDKAEMTSDKKCKENNGTFLMKVSDKIQGDRYYSITDNGKKCGLPGCCVREARNGNVLSCSNTMSHNCPSAKFYANSCMVVSSSIGGCPEKDICKEDDTDNGDSCFENSGHGVCHCYDGVAWYNNQGQQNEPCGNHGNSTCTSEGWVDLLGIHCEGSNMWHDVEGRSCGKNLYCCYEE